MSIYDHYSVVNAAAGVWRCDRCWQHVASPIEHERVCAECRARANGMLQFLGRPTLDERGL